MVHYSCSIGTLNKQIFAVLYEQPCIWPLQCMINYVVFLIKSIVLVMLCFGYICWTANSELTLKFTAGLAISVGLIALVENIQHIDRLRIKVNMYVGKYLKLTLTLTFGRISPVLTLAYFITATFFFFWLCTVSENKYSLICSTFTGTLNQLHFILFIHLSSQFFFQFLHVVLMEYACLLACRFTISRSDMNKFRTQLCV